MQSSKEDPIAAPANSPAEIVRAAKASLRRPSRPFTPADDGRRLFVLDDFGDSRPGSSCTSLATGFRNVNAALNRRKSLPPLTPSCTAGTPLPPLSPKPPALDSPPRQTHRPASARAGGAASSPCLASPLSSPSTAGAAPRELPRPLSCNSLQARVGGRRDLAPIARPPGQPPPCCSYEEEAAAGEPCAGGAEQPALPQGRRQAAASAGSSAGDADCHAEELILSDDEDQEPLSGWDTGGGSSPAWPCPIDTAEFPPWPGALQLDEREPGSPPAAPPATAEGAPGALHGMEPDTPAGECPRPRTPAHPAMETAPEPRDGPPERPETSRGRPGTARPGDPNRLDAPAAAAAMRVSFEGAPEGTRTLREGTQVFDVSSTQASSGVGPYETESFLAWRCALEATLLQLSASIEGRGSAPGASAGLDAEPEPEQHVDRVKALVAQAYHSGQMEAWIGGPSSTAAGAAGAQPSPLRAVLLEHLARCVQAARPALTLRAARLILLTASGPAARLSAARGLYTLSKDNTQDSAFRAEKLIAPLVDVGRTAVKRAAEVGLDALIYALGALKNLTTSDVANQRLVIKSNGVEVSTKLLLVLMKISARASRAADGSGGERVQEPRKAGSGERAAAQAAVQVTGLLRNLASSSAAAACFTRASTAVALSRALGLWGRSHSEIALNITRVLSKMSVIRECAEGMNDTPDLHEQLFQVLSTWRGEKATVLRGAFVLGNLTMSSPEARARIADIPGSLDTIIGLLAAYVEEPASAEPRPRHASATREEVLVKLVRLLANLSLDPSVGPSIAESPVLAAAIKAMLRSHSLAEAEELVLNCAALVTNLSFYASPGNKILHGTGGDVPEEHSSELLGCITPLLLCDNEEAVVEAARLYGNFSRLPSVRSFMLETRVVEALVILLDHPSLEVLIAVAGALINVTSDARCADAVASCGGCRALVGLLHQCALSTGCTPAGAEAGAPQGPEGGGPRAEPSGAGQHTGDGIVPEPPGDGSPSRRQEDAAGADREASLALCATVCKALCNLTAASQVLVWAQEDSASATSALEALRGADAGNAPDLAPTVARLADALSCAELASDCPGRGSRESSELEPL